MKNIVKLSLALMLVVGLSSVASENFDVDVQAGDEVAVNHHGHWHCTAYPEGHGHHHGYSYSDVHYFHARRGAILRCERATHHHCHHVDCHYDHH